MIIDIVLIPGLWLRGSSWDRVAPVLEEAGHRAHAVTLPGATNDADRSSVSVQDQIDAVVATIDACHDSGARVMLVGHSAGAALAHAALDARVDRVARVVYVGGFPAVDGRPVVDGFDSDGGEIPLPPWEEFDDADLRDLDEAGRAAFAAVATPSPASVAVDPVALRDERRHDVPVTMVCPEFTSEMLVGWLEQGLAPLAELAKMRHLELVDLPTGHWPQFTRPEVLGRCIALRANEPEIDEFGRQHPTIDSDEAMAALGFLDYQRATLAWKARNLDAAALRTTTASSTLTLGGLLKHMAFVEDHWFSYWLHGRERSSPWNVVDWSADRDWEFNSAHHDAPEQLVELWRSAAMRSRALVAAALAEGGFDRRATRSTSDGERPSL